LKIVHFNEKIVIDIAPEYGLAFQISGENNVGDEQGGIRSDYVSRSDGIEGVSESEHPAEVLVIGSQIHVIFECEIDGKIKIGGVLL
jgi:hypothetical protein